MRYLLPLACVVALCFGQVLFKLAATSWTSLSDIGWATVVRLLAAFGLYGIASLGWVLLLRSWPLSQLYPLMSLSFALVSMLGILMFDERMAASQWLGVGLIVLGAFLASGGLSNALIVQPE